MYVDPKSRCTWTPRGQPRTLFADTANWGCFSRVVFRAHRIALSRTIPTPLYTLCYKRLLPVSKSPPAVCETKTRDTGSGGANGCFTCVTKHRLRDPDFVCNVTTIVTRVERKGKKLRFAYRTVETVAWCMSLGFSHGTV